MERGPSIIRASSEAPERSARDRELREEEKSPAGKLRGHKEGAIRGHKVGPTSGGERNCKGARAGTRDWKTHRQRR